MRTAKDLKIGDNLPNITTGFGEYHNRIITEITIDLENNLWILTSYNYLSFDGRERKGKIYLTNKAVNPNLIMSNI